LEDLEMTIALPNANFWQGKRVLVTGHTGFKGGWLTLWLHRLGAQVSGIGLQPNTDPNLFELVRIEALCDSHFCDIRNKDNLLKCIRNFRPEVVFHLAAQPLVRYSYREPIETFSTNVMGTAHLLDALRGLESVKVAVIATTDKVYRNNEWYWPYREGDELGGRDPYSSSKAASEIVIGSYRESFLARQGVAVASARAGNIIGGGDWSLDRLIPDAIRAWQEGKPIEIRRPNAIRPWQYVLEPLGGYLILAEKLWTNASLEGAYNFGPLSQDAASVRDMIEMARNSYGSCLVRYNEENQGPHEAGLLTLDIAKARQKLGFQPRLTLADSIQRTIDWYQSQSSGLNPHELCDNEIARYEALR
jgi:CDP-glucose 4,6-dehydratase